MGLLDKLKGAVNAVTGGAAEVTFEYEPGQLMAGQNIKVKVIAKSKGQEVKSKGCFIDLAGVESVSLKRTDNPDLQKDLRVSKEVFSKEFQIAPEFVLKANETLVFEGSVTIPTGLQPSFSGNFANFDYNIRGRIEAFGNDPDSGYQPVKLSVH